MQAMLVLKIFGCIVALALGIWLGLPRRHDPDEQEIERALGGSPGTFRRVRTYFTPLGWARGETKPSDRRRTPIRRRFHTVAPKRPGE